MKNKFIFFIIIVCLILIFLLIFLRTYKNKENGNNNNNILNMSSYTAKIEVTIKSNKNTTKYIMSQEYKKGEYSKQIIEEPEQIYGLTMEYKNNNIKKHKLSQEQWKVYNSIISCKTRSSWNTYNYL